MSASAHTPRPTSVEAGPLAALVVSGHLLTLEAGLYGIFLTEVAPMEVGDHVPPSVYLSLPPNVSDDIHIVTLPTGGWLKQPGDGALVRVTARRADLIVTIYRPDRPGAQPPKLQVQRLDGAVDATVSKPRPRLVEPPPPAQGATPEIVAHIQRRGDVPAHLGEWLGAVGSRLTIEGFAIKPADVRAEDIEYQAVLGRGWLSPWVEGGEFCGSRGLGLPLLGLRVRLKGAAAERCVCEYSASFVDGSRSGPHADGAACETEDLAALEAFQLSIRPRQPGASTAGPAGTVMVVGAASRPARRAPGAARTPAKGKADAAPATAARTTKKSKLAEAPTARAVTVAGAASRPARRAPGAARTPAKGKASAAAATTARTIQKSKPGTSKRPRR